MDDNRTLAAALQNNMLEHAMDIPHVHYLFVRPGLNQDEYQLVVAMNPLSTLGQRGQARRFFERLLTALAGSCSYQSISPTLFSLTVIMPMPAKLHMVTVCPWWGNTRKQLAAWQDGDDTGHTEITAFVPDPDANSAIPMWDYDEVWAYRPSAYVHAKRAAREGFGEYDFDANRGIFLVVDSLGLETHTLACLYKLNDGFCRIK